LQWGVDQEVEHGLEVGLKINFLPRGKDDVEVFRPHQPRGSHFHSGFRSRQNLLQYPAWGRFAIQQHIVVRVDESAEFHGFGLLPGGDFRLIEVEPGRWQGGEGRGRGVLSLFGLHFVPKSHRNHLQFRPSRFPQLRPQHFNAPSFRLVVVFVQQDNCARALERSSCNGASCRRQLFQSPKPESIKNLHGLENTPKSPLHGDVKEENP